MSAAEHGEPDAAAGLLEMVELVALLGLPSAPKTAAWLVLMTRLRKVTFLMRNGLSRASAWAITGGAGPG